jgi:hypothetical protein
LKDPSQQFWQRRRRPRLPGTSDPMVFTPSCISDTVARFGLVELGQRDLLYSAAEHCRILAGELAVHTNSDTLSLCSEVIGYRTPGLMSGA